MSREGRKVLVVGALGVVGRAAMERFAAQSGVEAVGLSRRPPDFALDATWIAVDLQDAEATRVALAAHRDVTHVVYAALNEQPDLLVGWRDEHNVQLNTNMLRNTLDALDGVPLQHVTLMQGTKAYGVHTGRPMRVPAREQDALRDHANFYFEQQDLLAAHAARTGCGWTIFRPQIVLGVAVGSAMNPVAALGVYALLAREQGRPLSYPGHAYLLTECTDARLIAKAIEWAWQEPRANREVFNIANGDVIVWSSLFPRLATFFGMALQAGSDKPTGGRVSEQMTPMAATWRRIAQREKLRVDDLDALIGLSWQYADATWAARRPLPVPPLVSTIKIRSFGFNDCIDSEQCVIDHLESMRTQGYLPPH